MNFEAETNRRRTFAIISHPGLQSRHFTVKPIIPAKLLEKLRATGQAPPWRCKLQLRRGRTVYGVEINADGEITKVGGRAIYSAGDISFGPAVIEDAVPGPH
jgi:hypothetical protein